MNLRTRYMGFELAHPLVVGASPIVDDLDAVRRVEDAGAQMIVMHSLFEEQIVAEEVSATETVEWSSESYGEALGYFPGPEEFELGPGEYLEQLRRIKESVSVPVLASINGATEGGWLEYARLMQQAGADGLELNLFRVTADMGETGADVERRQLGIVKTVRESVSIPIGVKLSPFYSSIGSFAKELDETGVDALVLFNRFYEPDIDPEQLVLVPVSPLSSSTELLLRLRWVGILSGRVRASLAVTGGVHSALDAVKAVMVGAHAVQVVSALLEHGPRTLERIVSEMRSWLEEHEYESLEQMQGSMSQQRCAHPMAFERGHYMRALLSWHDGAP